MWFISHLKYEADLDSYSADTKKDKNNAFHQETKQCSSICKFTHSPNHTFLLTILSSRSLCYILFSCKNHSLGKVNINLQVIRACTFFSSFLLLLSDHM